MLRSISMDFQVRGNFTFKRKLAAFLISVGVSSFAINALQIEVLWANESLLVPTNGAAAAGLPVLVLKKNSPEDLKPFWRQKPALQKRLLEERAVIVSVKHTTLASDQIQFTIAGVGVVKREKDFCYNIAQQYPRLKEVSEHFKEIEFNPEARQLLVVTEALGYQARMLLRMAPVAEDWRSELQWEVIWGHFKGMTGLIGFERLTPNQTEMSLSAKYEADRLPLPKALMGFALEILTQKVAERMRTFIEAQPAHAAEVSVDPKALVKKAEIATDYHPAPSALDDKIKKLRLPKGFSISLFASGLPGARQMALSSNGTLIVGSNSTGKVFAIPNATKAKHAETRVVASGLLAPTGVAVQAETLFVGDLSRILRFEKIDQQLLLPKQATFQVIRDDLPTSRHHGRRYLGVNSDGWLYVSVGAPCNVCEKPVKYAASIIRMRLDGKGLEVFAEGVRNSVGLAWHPKSNELWFTDNGRDNLGEDLPSDELNHAPKAGLNFGFPYCHAGDLADPQFGKDKDCGLNGPYRFPKVKLGAHVASLGMKFYTGELFPEAYKHNIFIAEHGSWNRSKKVGYRISRVRLDAQSNVEAYETFIEGWLDGESVWGRPVDVLQMPDGSVLISDDLNGVIYRVNYKI